MTAPDQCCRNVRKFLPGRRPHVTQSGTNRWPYFGLLPDDGLCITQKSVIERNSLLARLCRHGPKVARVRAAEAVPRLLGSNASDPRGPSHRPSMCALRFGHYDRAANAPNQRELNHRGELAHDNANWTPKGKPVSQRSRTDLADGSGVGRNFAYRLEIRFLVSRSSLPISG